MRFYLKKIFLYLGIITSILTALNVFFFLFPQLVITPIKKNEIIEKYDKKFMFLNNVDDVNQYCDKIYEQRKNTRVIQDTALYSNILSETLKNRFHHGLARYSFTENWLLYLQGKLFWSHISAKVKPNDILKHSGALCSQQQLVFLSVLKHKKIKFRYVGLGLAQGPGHFVSEVWYNKAWHLYDVNAEPDWSVTNYTHHSMAFLKENPTVYYELYQKIHTKKILDVLFAHVEYGKPNMIPAQNMWLFHTINTYLLFILPLALLLISKKIKR